MESGTTHAAYPQLTHKTQGTWLILRTHNGSSTWSKCGYGEVFEIYMIDMLPEGCVNRIACKEL